jgi:hypothetical protein
MEITNPPNTGEWFYIPWKLKIYSTKRATSRPQFCIPAISVLWNGDFGSRINHPGGLDFSPQGKINDGS